MEEPLPQRVWLESPKLSFWQHLIYPHHLYCSSCKKVGHSTEKCSKKSKGKEPVIDSTPPATEAPIESSTSSARPAAPPREAPTKAPQPPQDRPYLWSKDKHRRYKRVYVPIANNVATTNTFSSLAETAEEVTAVTTEDAVHDTQVAHATPPEHVSHSAPNDQTLVNTIPAPTVFQTNKETGTPPLEALPTLAPVITQPSSVNPPAPALPDQNPQAPNPLSPSRILQRPITAPSEDIATTTSPSPAPPHLSSSSAPLLSSSIASSLPISPLHCPSSLLDCLDPPSVTLGCPKGKAKPPKGNKKKSLNRDTSDLKGGSDSEIERIPEPRLTRRQTLAATPSND